jgi:hypothetical protein
VGVLKKSIQNLGSEIKSATAVLRDLVWKNVRTKRTMRTKSVESPNSTGEEAV